MMSGPQLLVSLGAGPGPRWAAALRHPLLRHGLTVMSIVYLVWIWQFVVVAGSHVDAEAYRTFDPANPYAVARAGAEHAFLYAPVVAQLLTLVTWVPTEAFYAGLAALSIGSVVYLVGPRWAAAALLIPLPPLWQDLLTGNIHLLLAAAIVAGFHRPTTWSIVLLTKVTPGVGLAWFALRREWRSLLLALGATLALVAASVLLAPSLWGEWAALLLDNSTRAPQGMWVPVPLALRLVLALALVAWGARSGHRWTVPAAAFLALPIIWLYDGFALLAGVAGVFYHSRNRYRWTDGAPV